MIYPFRDGETFSTFRALVDKTVAEINGLENEYVLMASATELEDYYIQKVLVDPLVLYADDKYILDSTGTKIDVSHDFLRGGFGDNRILVSGTKVQIAVPFQGDPLLWQVRPSTFSLSGYPQMEVEQGTIVIPFQFPDDSASGELVLA